MEDANHVQIAVHNANAPRVVMMNRARNIANRSIVMVAGKSSCLP